MTLGHPLGVWYTLTEMRKTSRQLINNVIGQLHGVAVMVDESQDCQKVLIQMKAAQAALKAAMNKYLAESLKECWSKSSKKKKENGEFLVKQLINNL